MPPCKQQRILPRGCHGSVVLLRLTPQRRAWGSRSPPLQSDGRCKATQCKLSAEKMKSENRRRTCGIRQASATLSSLPTANVSAVSHANASSPAKPFRMTSDAHSLLSTPRSFNLPRSRRRQSYPSHGGEVGWRCSLLQQGQVLQRLDAGVDALGKLAHPPAQQGLPRAHAVRTVR